VAHPAATINVAPVARQHDQTHDGPTGYDRKETTQHGCQVTPRSHHTAALGWLRYIATDQTSRQHHATTTTPEPWVLYDLLYEGHEDTVRLQ
jgi:hypothetical protein